MAKARSPVRDVACPSCSAGPGWSCKAANGLTVSYFHAARKQAAAGQPELIGMDLASGPDRTGYFNGR